MFGLVSREKGANRKERNRKERNMKERNKYITRRKSECFLIFFIVLGEKSEYFEGNILYEIKV